MKKESVIKVLKVAPHKSPEVIHLENRLEVLQTAVSIDADYRGLIEVIPLSDKALIIANEEGKLINLEPNRHLGRDILCGVFYVAGQNEDGDFASLPEDQIQYYSEFFREPEEIPEEAVMKTIFIEFELC